MSFVDVNAFSWDLPIDVTRCASFDNVIDKIWATMGEDGDGGEKKEKVATMGEDGNDEKFGYGG